MKESCHICGSESLLKDSDFSKLKRVTSDCKPWPAGGTLAICQNCSFVQVIVNDSWAEQARQIYQDYTIYFQSGGQEQAVFDSKTGIPSFRSDLILKRICEHVQLPETGSWLDVGCGNGSFLRAGNRVIPQWRMSGSELNAKYKNEVESVSNARLYTCEPKEVPEVFDAVSFIHVLEHIPSPRRVLMDVYEKLKVGGYLVIEVPDCSRNPFMLLVADHCSHFSVEIAAELAKSCGFEIVHATTEWVPKEITIVARKPSQKIQTRSPAFPSDKSQAVFSHGHWLPQVIEKAHECRTKLNFGIFGTSIGGTWLYDELDGKIDFFVDEDPNRSDRTYLGKPILRPNQLPNEAHIFMALPEALATSVAQRISRPGVTCIYSKAKVTG
jgi:SAM-dependent methyltransferase